MLPAPRLSLDDDEVHVFVARPATVDLAAAEAALPEDERAWVSTFRFERHRREHLVSRALVRCALSSYRDVAPADWRWSIGPHGKPAIDPPCGIWFNASNHVDIVVCAVARHPDVGIDVEPLSRADEVLGVAETVFSTAELEAMRALPPEMRPDRALLLWTTKEAFIKASGAGMSAPVREITVDAGAAPPVVADHAEWYLDVRDREDARIAVCVRGPRTRPRVVLVDRAALTTTPSG